MNLARDRQEVIPSPGLEAPVLRPARGGLTLREIDRTEWETELSRFPDHTVFHGLPWLDALHAVHGGRWLRTGVEQDGRLVALWPFVETRRGPFRIVGSPLPATATTYLGPLFGPAADVPAVLHAYFRDPRFRNPAYFSCRVIDRARTVDLGPFGFSVVKRFETSWIDLDRPEEELWSSLKSECRTRIRKARSLGIEVRGEENLDFAADFARMTEETFARSGARPTHDLALVAEIWKRLEPVGALRVLSAFHRGARVATLFLPGDGRTMYYWAGATFDACRSLPAGNLLHWEAMLDGRRRGLSGYDLISAHGGPGRFKKSLGARVIHVATYWERSSSRLTELVKRGYEAFRRRRFRASTGSTRESE